MLPRVHQKVWLPGQGMPATSEIGDVQPLVLRWPDLNGFLSATEGILQVL